MNSTTTAIAKAIEKGQADSAIQLINDTFDDADPDVPANPQVNATTKDRKRTLLHKAFKHLEGEGLEQVVDVLLRKGADLTASDEKGKVPLALAQKYGHLGEGVRTVLNRHGANVPALLRQAGEARSAAAEAQGAALNDDMAAVGLI